MTEVFKQTCRLTLVLALITGADHREACIQETRTLFPSRSLFPELLAGPRDPATSFSVLGVTENPNAHGSGVEVEVSIGTALPVFLLFGKPGRTPVVAGIEAAVFARFGLQVLERELITTDWVFAFRAISPRVGVYGGLRYAYIVHPEESKRWVMRAGAQAGAEETGSTFRPFLATDVEWDQDAGRSPRLEVRTGVWLKKVGIQQALRLSLTFPTGPSPLGQFHGRSTTQVGLSLQATL